MSATVLLKPAANKRRLKHGASLSRKNLSAAYTAGFVAQPIGNGDHKLCLRIARRPVKAVACMASSAASQLDCDSRQSSFMLTSTADSDLSAFQQQSPHHQKQQPQARALVRAPSENYTRDDHLGNWLVPLAPTLLQVAVGGMQVLNGDSMEYGSAFQDMSKAISRELAWESRLHVPAAHAGHCFSLYGAPSADLLQAPSLTHSISMDHDKQRELAMCLATPMDPHAQPSQTIRATLQPHLGEAEAESQAPASGAANAWKRMGFAALSHSRGTDTEGHSRDYVKGMVGNLQRRINDTYRWKLKKVMLVMRAAKLFRQNSLSNNE